ncbi:ribosomal protein L7/L12 [Streptomyces nigra]
MTDGYAWLVCDEVPHDVVLLAPGPRTLDVVRTVRRLTGLSLWHSKALAVHLPAVILDGVPQEDAEAAVVVLREAGARAEARERPERGFR